MGSHVCKTQPENFIQNVSIREIPQLSPKIQDYIYQKKPFQKQISNSTKRLRKYHDGIYDGPIGFTNSPSGYGKFYKNDGSLYIGQFKGGKAEGQGVLLFQDGSYFLGNFYKNKFLKGQYKSIDLHYVGQFEQNLFHGKGFLTNYKDKYKFQGQFVKGKMKQGKLQWKQNKIQYIYQGKFDQNGQFLNGGKNQDNLGKLIEIPRGSYFGEYKNSKKNGKGTYQYNNGIKYIGQYIQGIKNGQGKLYNGDGTISYQGCFQNGLPHGQGKAYNSQGSSVQTNWIQGIDKSLLKIKY